MAINGNQWQSMAINGNHLQIMLGELASGVAALEAKLLEERHEGRRVLPLKHAHLHAIRRQSGGN